MRAQHVLNNHLIQVQCIYLRCLLQGLFLNAVVGADNLVLQHRTDEDQWHEGEADQSQPPLQHLSYGQLLARCIFSGSDPDKELT